MAQTTPSIELLSLSQAMLSAAEKKDWDNLRTLESRRQDVLKDLKAEVAASDSEAARDAIIDSLRKVVALNKRMIALGQQTRTELLEALGGLNQGRKAVNAYYGV